jgi:hypothetical protein
MKKSEKLTEQILQLNHNQTKEIVALEKERELALKEEQFDDTARELKCMYDSYVRVGFTESQAWELTRILFKTIKVSFEEDK